MGIEQRLQQRVRASKFADDDEDDEYFSQDDEPTTIQNGESDEDASDEEASDQDENEDEDDVSAHSDDSPDSEANPQDPSQDPPDSSTAFASISFGALASAQATLGTSLKRKRSTTTNPTLTPKRSSRSPSPFHEAEERRAGKKLTNNTQRSSKHAPTEISSKRAVSRKRTVVDVPSKPAARDPRFLSLSGDPANENALKANYAFLDEYRTSEMNELKAKARKEKDAGRKEALKKAVRAMEDRERARKKVEEERRVVSEHRKRERERVGQGKKPFFLKRGEVRKQVLREKFEGLSEKGAERVMERRRKKMAAKERRHMPDARRSEA